MPGPRRRHYRVRLRTAVAHSFLAAATAASLTGFTASPALAVPSGAVTAVTLASPITVIPPVTVAGGEAAAAGRLAGVRADLDQAVLLRLVTQEQADGFYRQIERRVAAGL